jgi:hypothetical protein
MSPSLLKRRGFVHYYFALFEVGGERKTVNQSPTPYVQTPDQTWRDSREVGSDRMLFCRQSGLALDNGGIRAEHTVVPSQRRRQGRVPYHLGSTVAPGGIVHLMGGMFWTSSVPFPRG